MEVVNNVDLLEGVSQITHFLSKKRAKVSKERKEVLRGSQLESAYPSCSSYPFILYFYKLYLQLVVPRDSSGLDAEYSRESTPTEAREPRLDPTENRRKHPLLGVSCLRLRQQQLVSAKLKEI
jgi:hypothetical protein